MTDKLCDQHRILGGCNELSALSDCPICRVRSAEQWGDEMVSEPLRAENAALRLKACAHLRRSDDGTIESCWLIGKEVAEIAVLTAEVERLKGEVAVYAHFANSPVYREWLRLDTMWQQLVKERDEFKEASILLGAALDDAKYAREDADRALAVIERVKEEVTGVQDYEGLPKDFINGQEELRDELRAIISTAPKGGRE